MQELKLLLVKQNYPAQIVDNGIQKAMALDRNVLRTVVTKNRENVVP